MAWSEILIILFLASSFVGCQTATQSASGAGVSRREMEAIKSAAKAYSGRDVMDDDIYRLADELKNNAAIQKAFKQFEQRRLKRTHNIVNGSWTIGRVAQIENKMLVSVRNLVIRLLSASINKRHLKTLYEVDF